MNRLFLFISFYLIPLIAASQNISIKGKANTYEYKEIGVWVNKDYISNAQKQLTYSVIDSTGTFLLEFKSKEILYITLKIDKYIASMYVEPNANYAVIISPPDSTTYQNPNIEHTVKLSISLTKKVEINALTIDYDKRFDDFFTKDYKSFVSRAPLVKIDSFKQAMHSYYSTVKNDFFDAYITYTIAALEEKTKMSQKKLFANYIQGKPILYNNTEYMNFFNAFYKQALQNFSLSKEGFPLSFQINDKASLSGVLNILKRNAFLPNDTLSELVLLKGLYESYYDGTFQPSSISSLLQQIANESKVGEHQQIARNILSSFSKLRKGTPAPYFELPDKTGVTHNLNDFKNKSYVYIMFYDAKCTSCLEQMRVITSFKKQYGERISFVCISNDKTNAELKDFCTKNPKFDWLFLYDNSNGQLKTNYEIKSLPSYFFINPEGDFVQVPAESPDGDIDRAFFDIVKPKAKLHNIGDKRDN